MDKEKIPIIPKRLRKCYVAFRKSIVEEVTKEVLPKLVDKFIPILPFGTKRLEAFSEHSEKDNFVEIMEDELLYSPKWVVNHDLRKLYRSELMLAYMPNGITVGVIQEMVYAKQFGMNCYTITNKDWMNHPGITVHSTIVTTKDKLGVLLERMYDYYED